MARALCAHRIIHEEPMLPVRLGVFTAIAALCLWGLFSLLDSLQEPGLLRSAKAVVIKGCDSLDSDQARHECPALFCEKALLDSKQLALTVKFEVTVRKKRDGDTLIAGRAIDKHAAAQYFLCELRANKVMQADLVESSALDDL